MGTPCNCAIVGGSGILVSGDGEGGSPYVIEADPGAEPSVAVADTQSIDMSVATAGAEYTVSGDVRVSSDSGNALAVRSSGLYVASGSGGPAPTYPGVVVKQTALQSIPNATFTRLRLDEITGSSPPGLTLVDGGLTTRFDVGHWIVSAYIRYSGTFAANNMLMFWALPTDVNTRLTGVDPRSAEPAAPQPGNHLSSLLTPIVGLTDFSLWVYQNSGVARDTLTANAGVHFTAKKLPV